MRTVDEILAQQRRLLGVFTSMFSAFAVIALVLAAVGLFAVTAYTVTQYTPTSACAWCSAHSRFR